MRKLLGFSLLISIVFLLLAVFSPLSALSAQDNDGPPKGLPDHELLSDYYLDTGQEHSQSTPLDIQSAEYANDYSMFTFMSLRENNWEIYTANHYGSDVKRLTSHGGVDSSPRFDIGSEKIVFDSNRTGNYDIYTMTRYGYGLQRITTSGADDYNPAWSPDGAKIVFVSDRDGQSEIYSMSASGGSLKRLTHDSAADYDPHWSPDGSKIVFASRRNGDGIWVMDANGSNQQQLVNRRFSQNPAWSPDGTQIAFDADGSGDGWQEIWVMNANGSNQRKILQLSSNYDPYVRSWSPDGKLVSFTKTHWTYYQGNWYWTSANAYYAHVEYGYDSHIGFGSSYDWYPDWQTTDPDPPVSAVNPLPEFSNDDVRVTWSGTDQGSGIEYYDVQYRLGTDGDWVDWRTDTTGTWADFTKQLGKTVYFRCRAQDRAGRVEEWPPGDGDTHTTFFNTRVAGHITDNTLVPAPGVTLTTTQQVLPIEPSDETGFYQALFDGYEHIIEVEFLKDGYGRLPATSLTPFENNKLDVLLPPADNLLDDPDFEAAALPTDTWEIAGLYSPTLSSETKHTGDQSALLGFAFDLETVAHFGADVGFSEISAPRQDSNGTFHVAWRQQVSGSDWKINYASGDRDGNWSEPVAIVPSTGRPDNIHFQVAADGTVHLVWEEYKSTYDILYHIWKDDSGWHDKQVVYNIGRVTLKDFKLDSQGGGHLLWYLSSDVVTDFFYSTVTKDGTWSAPERLYNQSGDDFYELEIDHNDDVHLLRRYDWYLAYSYRNPDGSWSNPEKIVRYWRSEEMGIDDNNGIHVVWANSGGTELHHAKRPQAGGWLTQQIDGGFDPYEHGSPAFIPFAGPAGTLSVFYREDNYSCPRVIHARINAEGQWTGTQALDPGSDCFSTYWVHRQGDQIMLLTDYRVDDQHQLCQMVVGSDEYHSIGECTAESTADFGTNYPYPLLGDDGLSHYFWRLNLPAGGSGLLHSRSLASPATGTSELWQSVSIPEEMTKPILSFAYIQGFNAGDPALNLQIAVDDGLQVTQVFTGTQTKGWEYQSVDLSRWASEDITIHLLLDQKAGSAAAWAYIDEVNIGSGHPDNWVTLSGPENASPGDVIAVALEYGNRSAASASGVILTATLPAEFEFLNASIEPSSSQDQLFQWDLGTLALADGTGVITMSVAITTTLSDTHLFPISAGLTSEMTELILSNNHHQIMVSVSRNVFLPIILK